MKAHIIPRFLADKALGVPERIEFGPGGRPRLAHNSWTDSKIVTREGEDRLRDIDTAAAREIKRLGISWRHFPLTPRASVEDVIPNEAQIIRIPDSDTSALRIFFLSLLWRSAVSSQTGFSEVQLPDDELDYPRTIILGLIKPRDDDFPVVLVVLTTPGQPQLLAPLAKIIDHKSMGLNLPNIPIFRFFLDGLIVHMGHQMADKRTMEIWKARLLGSSPVLWLVGRPYDGSFQDLNLREIQRELYSKWPADAERIYATMEKAGRAR